VQVDSNEHHIKPIQNEIKLDDDEIFGESVKESSSEEKIAPTLNIIPPAKLPTVEPKNDSLEVDYYLKFIQQ
jgi:hypothetical protein